MVSVRASRRIVFIAMLAAMGCKARNPDAAGLLSEETVSGEPTDGGKGKAPGGLNVCAAVRGNGHYILTHFGALARITEHYGTIDALAGGSSATVTMFMHESMKMNPLVASATGREQDLRMALLLKSILGYVQVLKGTPEAEGIMLLAGLAQKAQAQGIFALKPEEFELAATKLEELMTNPELAGLINPNVIQMLQNKDTLGYASYQYKVNEVKASAQSIIGFKAADQKIFFREGIVSFAGLAQALGRMANFYAGYAPIDMNLMTDFVESCSTEEVSAGKPWPVVAQAATPKGTCGELFAKALTTFRAASIAGGSTSAKSRVTEPMGVSTPSIISTAVLEGENAMKLYKDSLARYRKNKAPKFDVDFNDVKFGYWVPQALAANVDAGMEAGANSGDGKLKKFRNLGHDVSWLDVLLASPAEPGLSPAVPITDGRVSIGGWSDLSPVQVLQSAGCEKVVYVTRRQPESQFLVSPTPIDGVRAKLGVAEQLNMKEEDRQAIYVLDNPDSGFARAIAAASQKGAVWCTDWNVFGDAQIAEMHLHSYGVDNLPDATGAIKPGAELFSKDSDFTSGANAYKNQVSGQIVGCTTP